MPSLVFFFQRGQYTDFLWPREDLTYFSTCRLKIKIFRRVNHDKSLRYNSTVFPRKHGFIGEDIRCFPTIPGIPRLFPRILFLFVHAY